MFLFVGMFCTTHFFFEALHFTHLYILYIFSIALTQKIMSRDFEIEHAASVTHRPRIKRSVKKIRHVWKRRFFKGLHCNSTTTFHIYVSFFHRLTLFLIKVGNDILWKEKGTYKSSIQPQVEGEKKNVDHKAS